MFCYYRHHTRIIMSISNVFFNINTNIYYQNETFTKESISNLIRKLVICIHKHGIKGDQVVAVIMQKRPELLVDILALYICGIPFLPIDPAQPQNRIEYMLEEAKVKTVITDGCLEWLNSSSEQIIYQNEINNELIGSGIAVNEEMDEISYILFTSGTTGKPKGIQVKRTGLNNFLEGMHEVLDLSGVKRIGCFTTQGFDIFFLESLYAFYEQADIVIANEEEQRNPNKMAGLIERQKIDLVQFTPSRMKILLSTEKGRKSLRDVKVILLGGEQLQEQMLNEIKKTTTAKIYNMYGPTETTIWSSVAELTDSDDVHIGTPIKNTEFHIINEEGEVIDFGRGELCISGEGVAKGYLNRDELTNEKFINLFNGTKRAFKTGDVVDFGRDGVYRCLGRIDNQIKLNGYRIELEEIENIIFDAINVTSLVKLESNKLVVYYVSDDFLDIKKIACKLNESMPSYMVPTEWRRVKQFGYNINGKIDRKINMEVLERTQNLQGEETAINLDEKKFIDILNESLETAYSIEVLRGDVELESVGMDSVTFISMVVELEETFDIEFEDDMLSCSGFQYVRDLYRYVTARL